MNDLRKTVPLAVLAAALVAALTIPLALGLPISSDSARADPGITVGLDMDPFHTPANSCTGPAATGETCTLGTIQRCISVPATNGTTFSVDLFVNNLTNGFTNSFDRIHFPDTAGIRVIAVDYTAAVALGAQRTGSAYIDWGESLPDPPGIDGGSPYWQHGWEKAGAVEDETWTRGTVVRIEFDVSNVSYPITPGIYGLGLVGPAGYLEKDTTSYAVDQIWDGVVALGVPCPPVGGIAELPDVSGSSGRNYVAIAALAAAALLALTAGAWYARRRWLG